MAALKLCGRRMALDSTCTGPCTNLILDPGSSSLCYMVAGPLGGALGGSTRKWTHQRLGALTVLGKTNQDGEVHGSLSLTPRTLLTLGGAAQNHHVFRPFIRAPSKQPPTLAGDKKQSAGLAHTSDCPAVRCSEMLRWARECVALRIQ